MPPPHPPILAFDCETIPDVAALRRLHSMPPEVTDAQVIDFAKRLLRQKKGNDFFPHHLQRITVISCVLRHFTTPTPQHQLRIFSLPDPPLTDAATPDQTESRAINQFHRLIDDHEPILVSWNGVGFDLPVIRQRAIIHGLRAMTYNRDDGDYKWNNYQSRFHERHTDLMDALALYQPRAYGGLNDYAISCGLPGKQGIGGASVWRAWQENRREEIRTYCETDALLTYLLYLRYQHYRQKINAVTETTRVRTHLETSSHPHWQEFLKAWQPPTAEATQNSTKSQAEEECPTTQPNHSSPGKLL